MNNKNLILGAGALVIIVGFLFLSKQNGQIQPTTPAAETSTSTTQTTENPTNPPLPTSSGTGEIDETVVNPLKSYTIEAKNFSFSIPEIRVKKGQNVTIVFKNEEGFHDWVLDEFKVRTKQIKAGEQETVQFTADKTGTFEYYCSVGQHRANGMVGKLIVE